MILLACVASGVLLGVAQAEDRARECPPPPPFPDGPPPPHWGGGGGFGPPPGPGGLFLKDADANHDGRITHAEIDASIRSGFDKADYVLSGLPFSTLPEGVGPAIAAATRWSSAMCLAQRGVPAIQEANVNAMIL